MRPVSLVFPLLCILAFSSCDRSKVGTRDGADLTPRTYRVTFALACVPDEVLKTYGGNYDPVKNFYHFDLQDRYRFAAHVLKNPERYSVLRLKGNYSSIVSTGESTAISYDPQSEQAPFTFAKDGFTLQQFDASVSVGGYYPQTRQIGAQWRCNFSITEPPDARNGGGRSGGFVLNSELPDAYPLRQIGDKTLWFMVGLKAR